MSNIYGDLGPKEIPKGQEESLEEEGRAGNRTFGVCKEVVVLCLASLGFDVLDSWIAAGVSPSFIGSARHLGDLSYYNSRFLPEELI